MMEQWQRQLREQLEKIAFYLQESSPPSALIPNPAQPTLEATVQNLGDNVYAIHRKIAHGMQSFKELISELDDIDPQMPKETFIRAIEEVRTTGLAIINEFESSLKAMREGRQLQEILGISPLVLQTLYACARHLFEQQHYEQACCAFYVLSLLNPSYHTFWIGLGNCEYFLGRYPEAILAYTFAMQTDVSDPFVNLLVGRCYLAIGNIAAARASLALAESKTSFDERFRRQLDLFRQDLQKESL